MEKLINKISRSRFIKILGGIVSLPLLILFGKSLYSESRDSGPDKMIITGPLPEGITFHNHFIIIKSGHNLKVFSNRCTHLGCLINKHKMGKVQCPCHGSQFDLSGNAVKGPAFRPLKPLKYERNGDQLTVYFPSV